MSAEHVHGVAAAVAEQADVGEVATAILALAVVVEHQGAAVAEGLAGLQHALVASLWANVGTAARPEDVTITAAVARVAERLGQVRDELSALSYTVTGGGS